MLSEGPRTRWHPPLESLVILFILALVYGQKSSLNEHGYPFLLINFRQLTKRVPLTHGLSLKQTSPKARRAQSYWIFTFVYAIIAPRFVGYSSHRACNQHKKLLFEWFLGNWIGRSPCGGGGHPTARKSGNYCQVTGLPRFRFYWRIGRGGRCLWGLGTQRMWRAVSWDSGLW